MSCFRPTVKNNVIKGETLQKRKYFSPSILNSKQYNVIVYLAIVLEPHPTQ